MAAAAPQSLRRNVPVEGMHCAACAAGVETLISRLEHVEEAKVSAATHRAEIVGHVLLATLDAALKKGGYRLGRRQTRLLCSEGVSAAKISSLMGVDRVSQDDESVLVTHVDDPQVLDELRGLLPESGSAATEHNPRARVQEAEARRWLFSMCLAVPIALILVARSLGLFQTWPPLFFPQSPRTAFSLACLAVFVAGAPILQRAFYAVAARRGTMDVLVAVGALAALAYAYLLWRQHGSPKFLDGPAVIIALVSLGRWLEARAGRRTGDAVSALLRLAPETALLLEASGKTREVSRSRLLPGDCVRVYPGGRIPGDGNVVEGTSAVNESMLTGESAPIDKGPGDAVIGGTLNGAGGLDIRLEQTGAAGTLERMAAWVRRAQATETPVARLADRVAAVFVPVVLVIAGLTWLGWGLLGTGDMPWSDGLYAAIAVLLISCPCALGLATPTAVVVGTGRAAAHGILFRDGATLETAAKVNGVFFDKTGTLTTGSPEVVDVLTREVRASPWKDEPGDWDDEQQRVLAMAAGVESKSEHPLARAIESAAAAFAPVPVTKFESTPGRGASAHVSGRACHVGSRAYLDSKGVEDRGLSDRWEEAAATQGASPVFVAREKRLVGCIAVRDALRGEAAEAVDCLTRCSIRTGLVSGDQQRAVEAVATSLQLAEAHAECLPHDKPLHVKRWQDQSRVVAMVGDGVNDAPALVAADVGISFGRATDVAAEAARVCIVSHDLRRIPEALGIARATLRTIRQNLWWAFAFNTLAIPLAAAGLLDPRIAAGAMALSSFLVVSNSIRLRHTPIEGAH